MKLLYITTRIDGMGGLQRVVVERLNYWATVEQHEIVLLTTNSKHEPLYFTLASLIKHIDITDFYTSIFQYKNKLKSVVKTENPDVVLVSDNGLKSMLLPYFLPKELPVIYERHVTKYATIQSTPKILQAFKIPHLMLYFLVRRYTKIVVLSNSEKPFWNHNDCVVIPNFISFEPSLKSHLHNKKVLFVGRHSYQKGLDYLLSVWKIVEKEFPDWKLFIYGKETEEVPVRSWIQEQGLQHSVMLKEPIGAIEEAYAESSLLLMTSRYEGFGLVLAEAMSCGVPCVAFDCPTGPADCIQEGENGFLIPCFDVELFAVQVQKLLRDENVRLQMQDKAIRSVLKFQKEKVMHQWEKLLQDVIINN